MYKGSLTKFSRALDLNINFTVRVINPTRSEHLEQKFFKKVTKKSPQNLATQIQAALEVLGNNDFVIIHQLDEPHEFIQYCKQKDELMFDHVIVATTWKYRNLYWRYRTVLQSHGFKPYPYHKTGTRIVLGQPKYYDYEEESTRRSIQAVVTAEEGGQIGSECLELGLGITRQDQVMFDFGSWREWWQWI